MNTENVRTANAVYTSFLATLALVVSFLALTQTDDSVSAAKVVPTGFLVTSESDGITLQFSNLGDEDTELVAVTGNFDEYRFDARDTVIGGHTSVAIEIRCATAPCRFPFNPHKISRERVEPLSHLRKTLTLRFAHTNNVLLFDWRFGKQEDGGFWGGFLIFALPYPVGYCERPGC